MVGTRFGVRTVEEKGHKEGESGWNMAFGTEIDKRLEKAMFDFQIFVDDWRRRRRIDEINIAAFGAETVAWNSVRNPPAPASR